mgnify:CR=1 FL=1
MVRQAPEIVQAGAIGTLLIGLFATSAAPNGVSGLFYGGGFALLGKQAIATIAVLVYSFVVTWVIAKVLKATIGLRVPEEHELGGIDEHAHSERAYDDEQVTASPVSRRRSAWSSTSPR